MSAPLSSAPSRSCRTTSSRRRRSGCWTVRSGHPGSLRKYSLKSKLELADEDFRIPSELMGLPLRRADKSGGRQEGRDLDDLEQLQSETPIQA